MKPSLLPTYEDVQGSYQKGEEAALALFEKQAKIIRDLETKLQALEDQIAGTAISSHRVIG